MFFHKPCISLMITIIIIATYLFLSMLCGRVAIYVEFVVEGVIWPYRLNFASYGPVLPYIEDNEVIYILVSFIHIVLIVRQYFYVTLWMNVGCYLCNEVI